MNDELHSKFSSDPTDYDYSHHFCEDVINDDSRHMDWKKTCNTIRRGKLKSADGSADIEWVRNYHGVKVYVLAGWNEQKEVPVVITGWPAVHDPWQAVGSGRWNENELREINEFNNGDSLEKDFEYP